MHYPLSSIRLPFVGILIVMGSLTSSCGYRVSKVPTGGMSPAVPAGSSVIWDSTAYKDRAPERFDIVIHTLPPQDRWKEYGMDDDTKFIFRIVGLSGEKVEVKNGTLLVNDRPLSVNFETVGSTDNFGPILVPEGEYFLMGDNRPDSADSRFWKPPTVPRERILGKIVKIF